jgi:hypothetical protein
MSPLHAPTLGISFVLNKSCLGPLKVLMGSYFCCLHFRCFQSIQRLRVNATEF